MSTCPVKAAAYCRVSLYLEQSPEGQLVNIRQFAQVRGFDLVDEYVDHGVSGVRERRPGLDRLVADARRGRFKVLIVTGIDRIGRNTRHLLNLIHELSGYGVSLVSLRENIDMGVSLGSGHANDSGSDRESGARTYARTYSQCSCC